MCVTVTRRPRKATILTATLTIGAASAEVRVRDLSGTGARVDNSLRLVAGQSVIFDSRRTGRVGAVVAWAEGTLAGLTFERELNLAFAAR
jgi:hypothetical protein